MNIKFILFVFIATIFTSCVVLKTQTTKTMDIYGAGVIQKPIIVDLDVKEVKVSGTAVSSGAIVIEDLKSMVVADVLKKANADVLIEPKFEIEKDGAKTTIVVTGYPATYKNFRSIQKDDVELLKVGIIQKVDEYESTAKGKRLK